MIQKVNNSILNISNIADSFTMHSIAGLSVIKGTKLSIPPIIIAEMSSSHNMIDTQYTENIIKSIN